VTKRTESGRDVTFGRPQLRRRRRRSRFAALLVGLLAGFVWVPAAIAHAELVHSDPAGNAVLGHAPRQVRLWFSEAVASELSVVRVLDARGNPVPGIESRVEGELITVGLPPLRKGAYRVSWEVVSDDDVHSTSGELVFGAGAGARLPQARAAASDPSPGTVEVIVKWLNFFFLAGLIGALATAELVLRPSAARRRVLLWAVGSGVLAVVAGFGLLVAQAGGLQGAVGIEDLIGSTRWGGLWLGREAALAMLTGAALVLVGGALGRRTGRSRAAAFAVGPLMLLIAVLHALMSHAAGLTRDQSLAVGADALHVLGASIWVGGLLALCVLLARPRASRAMPPGALGRFSRLAALSMAVVIATGLYSAGRQVASVDALTHSLYGKALLTKTGLVLLVAVFAALNTTLVNPRVAAPLARLRRRRPGWTPVSAARLPALILGETALALVVLLAAGVLGAVPPPRNGSVAKAPEPTSITRVVDDLLIGFSARPNQPGDNVFDVLVASRRRPAPAAIGSVSLRLTRDGQGKAPVVVRLTSIDSNRYGGGGRLTSIGSWAVEVVVQRPGIRPAVAHFPWTVGSVPAGPVDSPRGSLERPLTCAAVVLLIALLAVAATLIRGKRAWQPPVVVPGISRTES
jgi:copper transport protein